ncbi:signal peptidase I [Luteolibacter yonseiensis]|uniref:Signal peptidase I n=1 Tax=Luteolibacter yonseiensis TaxID=1144680 RepID=A0A934R997_9BACT|nr:signal peptidase I [Luteolibacter yonseiensis]MBK1817815.1 signal peptidase I [Luteolibacter yonseiensis]
MKKWPLILFATVCVLGPSICFFSLYLSGYRLFMIPGKAMEPTIADGERTVARLSENYRKEIKRFDIVIYSDGRTPPTLRARRVVGLPGESISGSAAGISIGAIPIKMPSGFRVDDIKDRPFLTKIPSDCVYLLGDNPRESLDSRYTGPLPLRLVVGKLPFKH